MPAVFPATPTRRDFKNRVGQRFGRLVVIGYGGRRGKHSRWWCQCDCGGSKCCDADNMVAGRTTSCGCASREAVVRRNTTHGGNHLPEYHVWQTMLARCFNPKTARYPNYGGRGIQVCARWKGDFASFFADMGPRPSPAHSIDRIDNDGDYEPGNCRWATREEQACNRAGTLTVAVRGQRIALTAACKKYGIKYTVARWRISRGSSFDDLIAERSA